MTVDVERSVVIARPAGEVFTFVSDLSNEPRFHTDVTESRQVSPGPIGVGTTFEMKNARMGGKRATARVTRFVPGREIVFEGEMGKMRPVRTYRVEPEGAGARVSHRLQLQLTGPMRLMSFVMRRMVAKGWDEFLGNLKRVLEEGKA